MGACVCMFYVSSSYELLSSYEEYLWRISYILFRILGNILEETFKIIPGAAFVEILREIILKIIGINERIFCNFTVDASEELLMKFSGQALPQLTTKIILKSLVEISNRILEEFSDESLKKKNPRMNVKFLGEISGRFFRSIHGENL